MCIDPRCCEWDFAEDVDRLFCEVYLLGMGSPEQRMSRFGEYGRWAVWSNREIGRGQGVKGRRGGVEKTTAAGSFSFPLFFSGCLGFVFRGVCVGPCGLWGNLCAWAGWYIAGKQVI